MSEEHTPVRVEPETLAAIEDLDAVVHHAKRILLAHRVRDFQAADVLTLARMIMDREQAQR